MSQPPSASTHQAPVPPLLAIFFGILAVSTASIFIRYAQGYVPSLVVAAARLTLASLALAPLAFLRHRAELAALSRRDLGLALLSGVFLAVHFASWITSLEYTTIASSVVLVSTSPLWVALISVFTGGERLSRLALAGMALALIGGTIIGLSDVCAWSAGGLRCPPLAEFIQGQAALGDLLALVGALTAAGYLLIGRRLRAHMSLIGYIFIVYGMAALVLLAALLFTGGSLLGYPPAAYLWLALLALVPQLLGHSTFNWALRYLSAGYVSITILGEPIGSTILAYLLLAEIPTAMKLTGGVLILAGIYLASRGEGG